MTKKKKKILVVDDSPVMQKLTQKKLMNDGFLVFAAYDGKECLTEVKKRLPDLILMDVILPDSNGKEIVRKLKEDPETADIPIVFTTNTLSLEVDDGNQVFEINHVKYRAFAKPLHYRKLLSTIHKEINRSIHGGELPPGN
ncbi:MAG TPA: response regulator [Candidatus Omnitrophota bacterium]|nr:response regulator [Candidatus Omnitrophota bacterium]